jgi:NADH:ubiquinone oxidoreductase subunit E
MEKVSDLLAIQPDQTTPDMKFTLKSVRCIGCCGLAPAIMVGGEFYGKLTRKDLPGIVQKYREAA